MSTGTRQYDDLTLPERVEIENEIARWERAGLSPASARLHVLAQHDVDFDDVIDLAETDAD